MLEWLKATWAKYKVHVSVAGGALIVASVYGKCTFEPNVEAIEEAVEEAAPAEVGEVSTTENPVTATTVETEATPTEGTNNANTDDANTESTEGAAATTENTAE